MAKQFGNWTSEIVAGHRCDLFEPEKPSPHGYTVLYLHGLQAGRLGFRKRIVEQLELYGLRAVAPRAEYSWWSDRICPRFDPHLTAKRFLLEHILPFVQTHWNCEPPRLSLMGASMGGQGALRLAYQHPDVFPVVAAIYPSIDFHLRIDEGDPNLSQMYRDTEDARQDTATLHIHPLNWPRHQWFCCDPSDRRWHDSADRLRMKLYSLGVPFECDLETSAGGHTWEYFEHMASDAFRFVFERLEQERLHIV